ncbi:antitoxin VbhA family protein [Commensalibacter nepenthis]|uniref:Antitoxin VbhA domain-containing protein n=1 Tax=Commensalibacter nepenthis TaxID=3043872 RepID=A0ABT6Q4K8_9PROT|nr:hypothetical protein [Commensalibacter sp. TBRC 10068]MDI2111734.1 hypothetical protein [Commensalibacter sp. TBRC 10068]
MTKVKLSEKEIAHRLDAHKMSIADLRLDGLEPCKEQIEDGIAYAKGEITEEERIDRMEARLKKIIPHYNGNPLRNT